MAESSKIQRMLRSHCACRWLLLAGLAIALCFIPTHGLAQNRGKTTKRPRDVSQFRKLLSEKREKFAAALNDLAEECDKKGLSDAAAKVRLLAAPVDSGELRLPLPRDVQPPLPADLPADERFWQAQLRAQQQNYATELYALSRQAANAGHIGFALDLIREVARQNSDHIQARKILGFVRNGDEWVSAFESQMLKDKRVWTDEFGWLPKDQVARYERGERYYKRQWMGAAKEADLRRDFVNAWEIRTEHYLVKTNHSLERGVALARKLEDFHGLFFQMMAGFFNSTAEVQQLFAGTNSRPIASDARRNVVHYYRTREEYIAVLKPETKQPIEITKGIYFPTNQIAFFFYDPESDDDSTLYHEATHQLLSGSRPRNIEVGVKSDFWIIEGIACYMESFQREGNRFSVGDAGNQRLQAARTHFIKDDYYVPLREFTRMGMTAFQTAKEIRKNYSQGAALTHFFMHYDDSRYREALIEYLSQIYSPKKAEREHPESLSDLTGVDDEELDRQYAEYIRQLAPPATKETPPAAIGAEEP
jgi:hypothetical protein